MGIAAARFDYPLSSVVLQLPMAPFLPPARQRSVMSRDTTAHVRGGQAVPAHKHTRLCVCMCVSQLLSSSTSIWLQAATTAAVAKTNRPRCLLEMPTTSRGLHALLSVHPIGIITLA